MQKLDLVAQKLELAAWLACLFAAEKRGKERLMKSSIG